MSPTGVAVVVVAVYLGGVAVAAVAWRLGWSAGYQAAHDDAFDDELAESITAWHEADGGAG